MQYNPEFFPTGRKKRNKPSLFARAKALLLDPNKLNSPWGADALKIIKDQIQNPQKAYELLLACFQHYQFIQPEYLLSTSIILAHLGIKEQEPLRLAITFNQIMQCCVSAREPTSDKKIQFVHGLIHCLKEMQVPAELIQQFQSYKSDFIFLHEYASNFNDFPKIYQLISYIDFKNAKKHTIQLKIFSEAVWRNAYWEFYEKFERTDSGLSFKFLFILRYETEKIYEILQDYLLKKHLVKNSNKFVQAILKNYYFLYDLGDLSCGLRWAQIATCVDSDREKIKKVLHKLKKKEYAIDECDELLEKIELYPDSKQTLSY